MLITVYGENPPAHLIFFYEFNNSLFLGHVLQDYISLQLWCRKYHTLVSISSNSIPIVQKHHKHNRAVFSTHQQNNLFCRP